jgi:NTE family protein
MTPRQWLGEAPFTLALSAGFFGFFSHTGLLLALERAGLRPRRVVGVSAGALAGGLWASGLSASSLAEELTRLRREDFWDPGLPLGGVLMGRKFEAKLATVLRPLGVTSLEHCPTPFAAVVHDLLRRRPLALERGPIAPAIRASCTVPLMFRPRWHQGRLLVDGGASDRDGEIAARRGERVFVHRLTSRRAAAAPPSRGHASDRLTLSIPDLPRVTPFALHAGPVALSRTERFVQRWLDQPLSG